jgi:hypothetical protein
MIIGGLLDIVSGASLLAGAALLPGWGFIDLAVAGAVSLIWGIVILLAALSLMKLKYWAWLLVVVVNIINIILTVVFGGLISLIISIIILIYLFYQRDLFK